MSGPAEAAGRPCLVLPLGRDQPDNAAKVVAHGAGRRLSSRARPERIAEAVTALLREPDYAVVAARIGRQVRAETDDRRIVGEVEALVSPR